MQVRVQSQAEEGATHELQLIGTQPPWAFPRRWVRSFCLWGLGKTTPVRSQTKRRDRDKVSPLLWERLSFRLICPLLPATTLRRCGAAAKAYANYLRLQTPVADVSC